MLCALFIGATSQAQEYKVAKSTGRLDIREVNNVIIEGTTGNAYFFNNTVILDFRNNRFGVVGE